MESRVAEEAISPDCPRARVEHFSVSQCARAPPHTEGLASSRYTKHPHREGTDERCGAVSGRMLAMPTFVVTRRLRLLRSSLAWLGKHLERSENGHASPRALTRGRGRAAHLHASVATVSLVE